MRLTNNITLQEVVPKITLSTWGENSIRFLDKKIILAAQSLIDRYGSCIINNWFSGDTSDFRKERIIEAAPFDIMKV